MNLREKLSRAFLEMSAKYTGSSAYKRDARSEPCSAPNCIRQSYAFGYCNAHYLRMRSGTDMSAPIKNRRRGADCIDCGNSTNSKGGWHRCAPCYKKERRRLVKRICVEHFGDKCRNCEKSYPLPVYDFHHFGAKDGSISIMMADASPEALEAELAKCVLLCANCHRLEHSNDH